MVNQLEKRDLGVSLDPDSSEVICDPTIETIRIRVGFERRYPVLTVVPNLGRVDCITLDALRFLRIVSKTDETTDPIEQILKVAILEEKDLKVPRGQSKIDQAARKRAKQIINYARAEIADKPDRYSPNL